MQGFRTGSARRGARGRRWLAGLAAGLMGTAGAQAAVAGGFEVPDNGAQAVGRGGAFTVRADDLTAIAHNPGGLIRQKGAAALWSHNVMHAPMRFTRAPTTIPHGALPAGVDPLATVENQSPWFGLGAMVVGATDFGLDGWRFAAGVYGPNAAGEQKWPVSGGQRYMLTGMDVLLMYYSLAVAYGDADHFGVGLTAQIAHMPSTRLQLVIDGATGGDLQPYYSPTDVLATIELGAPPAVTAIAGGWWRPIPQLELALSGRIVPVYLDATGDVSLQNTPTGSQFTDKQLEVENSAARLSLVVPPTARAGVRYRHLDGDRELFDVELNVVYEAWSMLRDYKVELDGTIKLFAATEAPDVVISKRWRDTVSVRLGGTGRLSEQLRLSAGAYYETGAVPEGYEHLDFPSFDRLGAGLGAQLDLGPAVLTLAYSHVFQEDRQVSERFGKVFQQRPIAPCPAECDGYPGVPANAGTFESSFDILAASLQVGF